MIEFQEPYILFFLIPVIFIMVYRFYLLVRKNKLFPRQEMSIDHWKPEEESFFLDTKNIIREIFPYLRYLALGLLVLAASGPGIKREFIPNEKLGIDIMISLDISGSMVKSRDFLPKNRLDVSKILLEEFLDKRVSDRLGLVVFAGAAYLQSPLTVDRNALKYILRDIDTDSIDEQGTAIGDAILLSTYRLKSENTKSRIIILLTDGVSNTGRIDPETATETAKAYKIKIYSIGIGKDDGEYEVNFSGLEKISVSTGGKFFHAETPEELQAVLSEIDLLEKDVLRDKPKEIIDTRFPIYLGWAIFFLILDWGGRSFVYRFFV